MRNMLLLLLSFVLIGCGPKPFPLDDHVSGETVYMDDFSDTASGWDRTAKPIGSMDYYSGVYRIIVNTPDYDLWTTLDLIFTDTRLEVDAARFGGPAENRFGLICRYQDPGNFYFFIISSDGYTGIGRNHDGQLSLLTGSMLAYSEAVIVGIAPNRLRFDCRGDSLAGYVNGEFVAMVHDQAFSSGLVGMLAGAFSDIGVDILFEDFVVIKP